MSKELNLTGELRQFVVNVMRGVINEDASVEQAEAVAKLAKEVNTSLYSEAKFITLARLAGATSTELGQMSIGTGEGPKKIGTNK